MMPYTSVGDIIHNPTEACPFCGGHDVCVSNDHDSRREEFWILCVDCGARGPIKGSIALAIHNWNFPWWRDQVDGEMSE